MKISMITRSTCNLIGKSSWPIVLALVTFGCQATQKGNIYSANLNVPAYIRISTQIHGSNFGYFPQLDIFNSAGILVYASHNVMENSRALSLLPDHIEQNVSQTSISTIAHVLDPIPAFHEHETDILANHQIIILSISLDGCSGCSVQDEAIKNAESRLLSKNVNFLIITVARP